MSLTVNHLRLTSAEDVYELFRLLDYNVYDPTPFEDDELDEVLELDEGDRPAVQRAYIVADQGGHVVWLFEVDDTRLVRLRGLAHNALQRGSALVIVTKPDYKEVIFADPRYAGNPVKSNVRVSKLQVLTTDPTRHDADTLNQIHARNRTGQQIYDAQAEAFNVEKTTRKFYREYHTFYERARDLTVQYNPHIREFHDPDKLHAFVQRLLGRLMFLYFLQRKGWLGGERNFLSRMFVWTYRQHADEIGDNDESFYYYREVLEPLFFETMNTKRPDNITKWEGIRIPYLNGGLFDAGRDPSGIISLPDSLFDPNSSEGVLAFFNRYNFTVADDTPLEQDVAVDPEMLGKVFENLLEERDRGQSGSFYTPRAIVSYMCQEALAGYLEESAVVDRDTVRTLFNPDSAADLSPEGATAINAALDTLTVLDPAVGSGSFLIGMMTEMLTLRRACAAVLGVPVTDTTVADWKEHIIGHTLYGVDIKPEAIEIAQLRLWLAMVVNQTIEDARPLPNLDYKLMAGNSLIETIDGEPVLTEAAMQQFTGDDVDWQYVDAQMDMFRANPQQARMALFDDEKQAQAERVKLGEMRREFFRATPERRRQLRSDITAQERAIIGASLGSRMKALDEQITALEKKAAQAGGKWKKTDATKRAKLEERAARLTDALRELDKPEPSLPFFLYRLHFSEIFERKGGFDIVVANPPYVRGDALGDQKIELKAGYSDVYSGTADLYVYFYVRAYRLLRKAGQLAFITSNKFTRAKYGANLRGYLAKKQLHTLIDFGELPVFKEAATDPIIVLGSNQASEDTHPHFTQVQEWGEQFDLRRYIQERQFRLPDTALNGNDWTLANRGTLRLLDKMKERGKPLIEYVDGNLYRGIVTGFNTAFVIDSAKRDELIAADPKSAEIIKPLAVGDNIRKWRIDFEDKWLIFTRRGIDIDQYPAIKAHLAQWKPELTPKKRRTDKVGRKPGSYKWHEIQDDIAYYREFDKPKIIFPDIAKESRFSFDTKQTYSTNTTYFIPLDDYFLFGVLNSSAIWYYAQENLTSLGDARKGGRLRFFTQFVKDMPIPDAPQPLRDQIADLARGCLAAAADAPDTLPALEGRLNALVYQAYGLDAGDIAVIEGHLGKDE